MFFFCLSVTRQKANIYVVDNMTSLLSFNLKLKTNKKLQNFSTEIGKTINGNKKICLFQFGSRSKCYTRSLRHYFALITNTKLLINQQKSNHGNTVNLHQNYKLICFQK